MGVAQAKPACKHTIATRKCYQYNTISSLLLINIVAHTSLDDQSTICKSIKSARYTQRILCDGLIVTEFIQYNTIQYNTIQYNTTSFISNIEHNNITPTICSQHWDGWKGGGQKNIRESSNLTVLHTQTGYTLKPCTRRFQVVS